MGFRIRQNWGWGIVVVVGGDNGIGDRDGFEGHVHPCQEWEAHKSSGRWEDWNRW